MQNWLKIVIVLWLCSPLFGVADEKSGDHSAYVQHVEKAFMLMFQGDNQGAISEFEAALTIEPEHAEILHYLGMAYAQEDFWNKAVARYERALTLMPDSIEALYSLGIAYFRLDRWEDAVAVLRQVVELSPEHARGHEVLGKSLVKLRQYAEAVPVLKQAITLKPQAPGIYHELGTAYLNLKEYPKAIESFKQAVELGPARYADPHHGLGTAYLRMGDREKSRAEMQIYQQYQKEYAEYERLTRLTRNEPNNLEAWAGLATLLMTQKNYARAVQGFQRCIELDPNNANFLSRVEPSVHESQLPQTSSGSRQQSCHAETGRSHSFITHSAARMRCKGTLKTQSLHSEKQLNSTVRSLIIISTSPDSIRASVIKDSRRSTIAFMNIFCPNRNRYFGILCLLLFSVSIRSSVSAQERELILGPCWYVYDGEREPRR